MALVLEFAVLQEGVHLDDVVVEGLKDGGLSSLMKVGLLSC